MHRGATLSTTSSATAARLHTPRAACRHSRRRRSGCAALQHCTAMPPRPSTATGIRGAYETLGVQGFYEAHGSEYVNPHDDQVVAAIAELMSSRAFSGQPGPLRVLDLACGSGEATLALEAWASRQQQGRQQQQQQQAASASPGARRQRRGAAANSVCPPPLLAVTACDPYTQQAYERRTGRSAHPWSYQDIADGCLAGACVQGSPRDRQGCRLHCGWAQVLQLGETFLWASTATPHPCCPPMPQATHSTCACAALRCTCATPPASSSHSTSCRAAAPGWRCWRRTSSRRCGRSTAGQRCRRGGWSACTCGCTDR